MTKSLAYPLLFAAACHHSSAGDGGSDTSSSESTSDEGEVSTATSTASTTDATGGADGTDTTGGDEGPYSGVWCGNASTGRLEMGVTTRVVQFAGAGSNPSPIVAWLDDAGGVLAARYDVASASWSDAETLATDFPADLLPLGNDAFGAVGATGDAVVAYAASTPDPHIVVHRFDAATQTWAREDLPETFNSPQAQGVILSSSGHAVLWASDVFADNSTGQITIWQLDPDSDAWTAEPGREPESWVYGDTIRGATDPLLGDILLVKPSDSGLLSTWRFVAADDQVEQEDIQTVGDGIASVVPLGDGAFSVVTSESEFDGPFELHAHRFDGATWQPMDVLASGYGYPEIDAVGDGAGRVGVAWTDSYGGAYSITFDEGAWSPVTTLAADDDTAPAAVASQRVALEDAGELVVWAAWNGGLVTPSSEHFDGEAWGSSTVLDPYQQPQFSEVLALDSLGSDRARAVWSRYDRLATGYAYACHTPSAGWSVALPIDIPLLLEARPDGEFLLVTQSQGAGYAEYFAAAP